MTVQGCVVVVVFFFFLPYRVNQYKATRGGGPSGALLVLISAPAALVFGSCFSSDTRREDAWTDLIRLTMK